MLCTFCLYDGDYALYLDLLDDAASRANVGIWSYCLMPNHVDIVATPCDEGGLWRIFRCVHRHYTGFISARMRVTGHLWQARFSSVAMDEEHLAAMRALTGKQLAPGKRGIRPLVNG